MAQVDWIELLFNHCTAFSSSHTHTQMVTMTLDIEPLDGPSRTKTETSRVSRKKLLLISVAVVGMLGLVISAVAIPLSKQDEPLSLPAEQPTTETEPPAENPIDSSSNTHSPSQEPSPLPTTSAPTTSAPTTIPLTILGGYELLETVPHDSSAFTQGLELMQPDHTHYYESTGLYGESSVRIVELRSGNILQIHPLEYQYFGEGLTYYRDGSEDDGGGKLVQITYRAGTGFVYDASDLSVIQEFSYTTTNGQGWGICYQPLEQRFLVSDGTYFLHTWDASFRLVNKVPVTIQTATMTNPENLLRINELEWDPFTNTVLANVWQEDYIVRINPNTGFVTHRYDLQSLWKPLDANVLNGIAATNVPNEIWVTGKLWPSMYRIRLDPS